MEGAAQRAAHCKPSALPPRFLLEGSLAPEQIRASTSALCLQTPNTRGPVVLAMGLSVS